MTAREFVAGPRMPLALGALVIAVGVATWTMVRAVRGDAVPEVAAATFATADALAPRAAVPPTDIRVAVDNDPFEDDRSAPTVRYKMPDDVETSRAAPAPEPDKPVVLGVAVSVDGVSFATCTLSDDRTRIVHVGDRLGMYTVQTIERGRVVFTTANGKQLEIRPLR